MHLPTLLLALLAVFVAAQNSSFMWSNLSSAPQCITQNCHPNVASLGNCSSTDMACNCKVGAAVFAQLTPCVQSQCADLTGELPGKSARLARGLSHVTS